MTDLNADAIRSRVEPWFEANFVERGELGASVAVWVEGREVLQLSAGFCDREQTRAWEPSTLVPVWSTTKGVAALTCGMALEAEGVEFDATVASLWPEFGQSGKADITLRQLLNHEAGLAGLDERVSILDNRAVVEAIERQAPVAPSSPAYHARTFGFLVEEVLRRCTGAHSLGAYFREKLGDPLGLDFWIGLPESEDERVATLASGRMNPGGLDEGNAAFLKAFQTPGSYTLRAFQSPAGLNAVQDLNQPSTWRLGLPSMGGVGSASSLAKLYGILANGGIWQARRWVPESVLARYAETQAENPLDPVLHTGTAFSAGMMKDPVHPMTGEKRRELFGPSTAAFGHPGAGGSLAFADPEHRIGFAYVMNQMEVGVLPTEKALGLVRALYGSD